MHFYKAKRFASLLRKFTPEQLRPPWMLPLNDDDRRPLRTLCLGQKMHDHMKKPYFIGRGKNE